MINNISEFLSKTSTEPGVYLMRDAKGAVIYVGKARNLKKRLASYFQSADRLNLKTGMLVDHIHSIDTIITASENEALILESNLIKKHLPHYNVILKDGKRYPSLRLDTTIPYPNLTIVRKPKKDGAKYFGPFSSSSAVKQTLKLIHKHFQLRKCGRSIFRTRTRPCLNYQMGICLGPCCVNVPLEVYDEVVREVSLFLKGRTPELIRKIKAEMARAAVEERFEQAAVMRDRMFALERTLEKQVCVTTDFMDRDVLSLAGNRDLRIIFLMSVRGGYILAGNTFQFGETLADPHEVLETFIRQYYERAHFIPKEILTAMSLEDSALLENRLSSLKGEKVSLIHPLRGEKRRLVEMAQKNAEKALEERTDKEARDHKLLERLQKRLDLSRFPRRIECFDNSNIQGTAPVAGKVAFENGVPDKSGYRRYKIKTVEGPDDYATMAEVLRRRFGKEPQVDPYPDLLMVDGGKGQLNIAVSVLKDLGVYGDFDVVGIAKGEETRSRGRRRVARSEPGEVTDSSDKIYKPGRANSMIFGRETDLLLFLQQVRDEAHRFAISFYRKRHRKKTVVSVLDGIPGIGKKRKQQLLKHFGGIRKIRTATVDDLCVLPGFNRKTAETVITTLNDATP